MADYTLGGSGESMEDLARRMQNASSAIDEVNRKEEARRSVEEDTAAAEGTSAEVRSNLARATEELTAAVKLSANALSLETVTLHANTAALERNLAARQTLRDVAQSTANVLRQSETALATGVAPAPAQAPRAAPAPIVAPVIEDRAAADRAAQAEQRLRAAEARRSRVEAQLAASVGSQGTDPTRVRAAEQQLADAERRLQENQRRLERATQAATLATAPARPAPAPEAPTPPPARPAPAPAPTPERAPAPPVVPAAVPAGESSAEAEAASLREQVRLLRQRTGVSLSVPQLRTLRAVAETGTPELPGGNRAPVDAVQALGYVGQPSGGRLPLTEQGQALLAQLDQAIRGETVARTGAAATEREVTLSLAQQARLLRNQTGVNLTPAQLGRLQEARREQGSYIGGVPRTATTERLAEQGLLQRSTRLDAWRQYVPTERGRNLLDRLDETVQAETQARSQAALAEQRSRLSVDEQIANLRAQRGISLNPNELALLSNVGQAEAHARGPYRVPSPERFQQQAQTLQSQGLIEPVEGTRRDVRITEAGRQALAATVPPPPPPPQTNLSPLSIEEQHRILRAEQIEPPITQQQLAALREAEATGASLRNRAAKNLLGDTFTGAGALLTQTASVAPDYGRLRPNEAGRQLLTQLDAAIARRTQTIEEVVASLPATTPELPPAVGIARQILRERHPPEDLYPPPQVEREESGLYRLTVPPSQHALEDPKADHEPQVYRMTESGSAIRQILPAVGGHPEEEREQPSIGDEIQRRLKASEQRRVEILDQASTAEQEVSEQAIRLARAMSDAQLEVLSTAEEFGRVAVNARNQPAADELYRRSLVRQEPNAPGQYQITQAGREVLYASQTPPVVPPLPRTPAPTAAIPPSPLGAAERSEAIRREVGFSLSSQDIDALRDPNSPSARVRALSRLSGLGLIEDLGAQGGVRTFQRTQLGQQAVQAIAAPAPPPAETPAAATEDLGPLRERQQALEQEVATRREELATARASLAESQQQSQLQQEKTAALRENIAQLDREIEEQRQAVAAAGGGGRRPPAPPPAPPAGPPGGPPDEPPDDERGRLARLRYQQAIEEQERARAALREGRRQGLPAEQLAPLVLASDDANRAAQAARAEVRAAERAAQAAQADAAAQAAARRQATEELAADNRALAEQRAADEQAARQAVAAAETERVARTGQLRIAGLEPTTVAEVGTGAVPPPEESFAPPRTVITGRQGRLFGGFGETVRDAAAQAPRFGVTRGGPVESLHAPTEELQNYQEIARANAESLATLEARQRASNVAFQQAGAIYADTSTRLSRHGALTTEFIQALARGQVSMREFGEQMVATIGKFGGWAIAGAAVYGVYGAFRDLLHGATETQAAVQQIGRFIPGLGGVAGGGRAAIPQAEGLVRDISTQFNVPISEVTSAMSVVSRVFHNLGDAGDATRAVLAAVRLDQVPEAQATQYLVGISQSLGFTRGRETIGVVNSLNALQADYGARVAQTLPAIARAAPAARAEGLDLSSLEALAALGVRSGQTGNQVGTAILRGITRFAFTPSSELTFQRYGIQAQVGQGEKLISDIFRVIDERARKGTLRDTDVISLATALGGPQLGARSIAPILEQEALQPGLYTRVRDTAERPGRDFTQDLNSVLGTVSERFKAIGIQLQAFGSELYQLGAFTPIKGLLDGVVLLTQVVTAAVRPFATLFGAINEIPGPLRDALGVLIAFRALRSFTNSQFGGTAQQFLGRLPTFAQLNTDPISAVQGTISRFDRELIPQYRSQVEAASARQLQAAGALTGAQENRRRYEAENAAAATLPLENEDRQQYERGAASLRANESDAAERAAAAEQEFAQAVLRSGTAEAQLAILKDRHLSFAERAAFLEQQGLAVQESTVNVRDEIEAQLRAQLGAIRGTTSATAAGGAILGARPPEGPAGGGASLAGAEEVAIAGGGAAALAVAAGRSVIRDPSLVRDINTAATREQLQLFGTPPPETLRARPSAATEESQPIYASVPRGPLTPEEAATPAGLYASGAPRGAPRFAAAYGETEGARYGAPTSELGARLQTFGERVREATSRVAGFANWAAGPGLPFAGLLGSQLIGNAIGGGVGNYIATVGGSAATGAFIGQALRPESPAFALGGAALGTVAGGFQQSSAVGIASTVAGLAGAGIGAFFGGPVGAGVGAFLGTQAGALGAELFGGGGSQKNQQDFAAEANKRIQYLLTHGSQLDRNLAFGAGFAQNLEDSLTGTGDTSAKGQASVKSILDNLTAQVQLYGLGGLQGRGIVGQQLGQTVSAAISLAGRSPQAATQVIQTALQPANQIIQDQFSYRLSQAQNPQQAARAAQQAGQASKQLYDEGIGQGVASADDALKQAWAALEDALMHGSQAAIKNALGVYQSAVQNANAAHAIARLAGQANTLAQQARAQQAYSQASQDISTSTGLASSRAGGDPQAQLRAQLAGGQKQINLLYQRFNSGVLGPAAFKRALQSADQQQTQLWTQFVQGGLARVQAEGAISVANAPIGDPVAAARLQVQATRNVLAYMEKHAKAFDPAAILGVIAQLDSQGQALTQTIAQQAQQMASLSGQIAAAHDYGNSVAQAQDLLQGARNSLTHAVGPVAKAQGQLEVANQENAVHQAAMQRIQAQGQLAASEHPNDALAIAQVNRATAQRELAAAHGYDEVIAAEAALNQANNDYHNALENRAIELGALAASETIDPVKALKDQVDAATKALNQAVGFDAKVTARTNRNNLVHQWEAQVIDTRESTINFQFQMMDISAQQAIHQLEGLLKLQGLTKAKRQAILEEIRRYQDGLESPIGGSGQFNLAPGNIRLPTLYDIAHALGRSYAGTDEGPNGSDTRPRHHHGPDENATVPTQHHGPEHNATVPTHQTYNTSRVVYNNDSKHVNTTINVYVRKSADVAHVADAIDRVTGAHLRHRLRAAGVT